MGSKEYVKSKGYGSGTDITVQDLSYLCQEYADLCQSENIKRIEELEESIKLHEKYIQVIGNELIDAGNIAKIAGWRLKHEIETTELVVKITAINNKLNPDKK